MNRQNKILTLPKTNKPIIIVFLKLKIRSASNYLSNKI